METPGRSSSNKLTHGQQWNVTNTPSGRLFSRQFFLRLRSLISILLIVGKVCFLLSFCHPFKRLKKLVRQRLFKAFSAIWVVWLTRWGLSWPKDETFPGKTPSPLANCGKGTLPILAWLITYMLSKLCWPQCFWGSVCRSHGNLKEHMDIFK